MYNGPMTTTEEDFNPYDAELHELKIVSAVKKLSDNQIEQLVSARINDEGQYRINGVYDERTATALSNKDILVGRSNLTDFGAEVVERLFQRKFGQSVSEHTALDRAREKGQELKRLAKLMKIRQRVAAVAPVLDGLTFETYVRREGYKQSDAVTHMMNEVSTYSPSEPTITLTLDQLEQLAGRL